jgi:hypothetical protein
MFNKGLTYEIVRDGEPVECLAIKCLMCGMTSYHPMDVKEKYCGNCHQFHNIMEAQLELGKDKTP